MELFGFRLDRSKKEKTQDKALKSFVVPTFDDGAIPVEAGGFYGQYVNGSNINYSGLYRDHVDGKFRAFFGSIVDPIGNTISTSDSGYTIATLVANLTGGTVSGLTANITVGDGGTGRGTFTANGILFGNATGVLNVTAAGTAGQILTVNANGIPSFTGIDGGTY